MGPIDDWLKLAKDEQQRELLKKLEEEEKERAHKDEILEAEAHWMERMIQRIQEVAQEGFHIHVKKAKNSLELYLKGKVQVEFAGHLNFHVIYRNVSKPSNLMVSRPISVYHHRLVKLRELHEHNIEEILKFVVLGMQKYCEISKFSRIERNLHGVLETGKIDEHV